MILAASIALDPPGRSRDAVVRGDRRGRLVGFLFAEVNVAAMMVDFYRMASAPTLLAIPLFTFAGYLLAESRAPQRLLAVSRALLGWMPGGVALVTLITCAGFTAFTGASGATIVALGGLCFPCSSRRGFRKGSPWDC